MLVYQTIEYLKPMRREKYHSRHSQRAGVAESPVGSWMIYGSLRERGKAGTLAEYLDREPALKAEYVMAYS